MTPVIFKFITPQGIPIANHPFYVTLRKAALHKVLTGVVHPEVIAAVTDDQGMATLSLFPADQPYYVTMDAQADVDGDTCQAAIRFRIAVPDSTTPVYADSLVVQDPIFSQAWDAEAIEVIMLAKAAAIASAAAAMESEQHAKASEDAAKASEINSKASELAASASEVAAKDSQVASAASELNAAGSAAAALVSQNESKFSETNAKTSEVNAATSAAAAYQSATAAAASELNAANSSSAALASQNAAAASEASASQSATAASNSSAQAQASEVNAKASELMAQKWAANPEDEAVAGSQYSALHYAMKARDALVAVNTLGEAGALPEIPTNNFIGNHECNDSTDWDAYAVATVTSNGEKVTVRKDSPAGNSSGARVALPFFNGATDHILYAKLRTDAGGVLWLLRDTGVPTGAVWFEADPSSVPSGNAAPGKVFLQTRSNGASVATELLYIDAKVNMVEVAVHFDVSQAVVNVWYKIAGSWVFAGRGPYEWSTVAHMGVAMANSMPQNGTVELDYISVCRPNLVIYGDSIGVGSPGWSNGGGSADYLSHYTAYASFYRGLRNNLPINKSVGGLSTAGMLNNVGNVQNTGAKLVILHASSNDYQVGAGPDFPTRTAQTQQLVDALLSAGAAVVLLNAVPGTPDHPWNKAPSPVGGLRDYTNNWWEQESPKILGLSQRLNIAEVIRGLDGYQDTGLTVADGIHLTVEGYRRIGVRMREFYSTGFPRELQKKQDQHRILDQMSKLVPYPGGIPLFVSGDGSLALNASGVFGRTFLAAETEAAGRSALGLGTAAVATLQTSLLDNVTGRALTVGAFGMGAYTDMRGHELALGAPSVAFGRGRNIGMVSGGTGDANALAIPQIPGLQYGYLQVDGHFADQSALGAILREFTTGSPSLGGPRKFIQRATSAEAWGTWAEFFTTYNAVGPVNSNVHLSAIVETGSNANGRYTRFIDGTQICEGSVTLPAQALGTDGSIAAAFALPFVGAIPRAVYSPINAEAGGNQNSVGLVMYNGTYTPITLSTFVLSSYSYRHATDSPVTFGYIAYGRWK